MTQKALWRANMVTHRKNAAQADELVGRLPPDKKAKVERLLDTALGFLHRDPTSYEVGKWFHQLEIEWKARQHEYGIPFSVFDDAIDSRGEVGGRRSRMRTYLKRFYRVYADELEEHVRHVTDKYARVLAVVYGGRNRNRFRTQPSMPSAKVALQLVKEGRYNAEALQHFLSGAEGIFRNESEICEYLRLDDCLDLRTTLGVSKVLGRARLKYTGEPDFIGHSDDTVLVIEVEHTARAEDVGQTLGFLSEAALDVSQEGYVIVYGDAQSFSRDTELERLRAVGVSACIIAQTYHAGAFFAARTQPLLFYRITGAGALAGPLDMQYATWDDWMTFTANQVEKH